MSTNSTASFLILFFDETIFLYETCLIIACTPSVLNIVFDKTIFLYKTCLKIACTASVLTLCFDETIFLYKTRLIIACKIESLVLMTRYDVEASAQQTKLLVHVCSFLAHQYIAN